MIDILKRLQASDENTKRRWLIASSTIMIVLVVFIWLKYFNALVQPANAPIPAEQAEQGLTFWQTFKSGLGIIYQSIDGKIKTWLEILGSPKNYNIQP